MKEQQIQRMNFLRHGRSAVTYRTLLYVLAGWVVFLGALYGLQVLRWYWLGTAVEKGNETLVTLNEEKDRQIEMVRALGKKRSGTVSMDSVVSILSTRPMWSDLLRSLTRSLPSDVWLKGVGVTGGAEEWYTIRITGQAKSQRALTTFIMQLESSGAFRQTSLGSSKLTQAGGIFDFELTTQPVMKKLVGDG